ncbi:patatin-like phospholipase family protein [Actinocorallia herbida]|uniref:patatin-like phospholipase family protein n=1 Tax=Actinocorallia herbida TaxID=58109 RepID=UPI001476A691|nr:patatin-like phospholipase family protein [Actinocorallia herbida]
MTLVLGPGGPAGTSWLVGLARGLRARSIDLASADVLVGTSAGAIAAAVLGGGRDLAALEDLPADSVPLRPSPRLPEVFGLLGAGGDPAETRRLAGRLAMETAPAAEAVHVAGMAWLLGGDPPWPDIRLLIPTVAADSGEPRVWTSADGIPLVRVVAASTAFPGTAPPVVLDGAPHIDGALRAGVNADLAPPGGTVVLVEPMARMFPGAPPAPGAVRVVPDDASAAALADPLDVTAWTRAHRAGLAQAEAVAPILAPLLAR